MEANFFCLDFGIWCLAILKFGEQSDLLLKLAVQVEFPGKFVPGWLAPFRPEEGIRASAHYFVALMPLRRCAKRFDNG